MIFALFFEFTAVLLHKFLDSGYIVSRNQDVMVADRIL